MFTKNFNYAPDGSGGGTGDKDGDAKSPNDSISKAEYDKTTGDLKQQLEDMRLEIMTPEYIAFLEQTNKKPEKKEEPKPDNTDYSKMTPDQIVKMATDKAEKAADEKLAKLREEFSSKDKDAVTKEIAAFARVTPDYDRYRPLMIGIARDPKNTDLTLRELYDKAKEYAKSFGPSEEDMKKSKKSQNERPGGSSGSVKKDKKYSADEAAEEAWSEVVGDNGFPSA